MFGRAAFAQDAKETARVIKIRKLVEKSPDQKTWTKLRFGTTVAVEEFVKTGPGALATLRFNSGSKINIGENSCIVITKATKNTKESKALWGTFNFDVDPKDRESKFKVITPVAVAGAEGTNFTVTVDKKTGATEIFLFSGKLKITSLTGKFKDILLMPDFKVYIDISTVNLIPAPILENEYRRYQSIDVKPQIQQQITPEGDQGGESPTGSRAPGSAVQTTDGDAGGTDAGTDAAVPEIKGDIFNNDSRLIQTGQEVSAGFVDPVTEEEVDDPVIPVTQEKTESRVIIEIVK